MKACVKRFNIKSFSFILYNFYSYSKKTPRANFRKQQKAANKRVIFANKRKHFAHKRVTSTNKRQIQQINQKHSQKAKHSRINANLFKILIMSFHTGTCLKTNFATLFSNRHSFIIFFLKLK